MSQAEIARRLGISPALVTKYKKLGMPVDSAGAAQAWRQRHVAPYVRSQPSSVVRPAKAQADIGAPPAAQSRPQAGRPQTLEDLLTGDPPAHPADVIEALMREHVLLPRPVLQPLIAAVDEAVRALLQAGLGAAMLRPCLLYTSRCV